MNIFENLPAQDQARLEDAAAWWERLRKDPAIELSAEFLEWVADPVNCRALKAVESTMAALDDFGATPMVLDMRRAALRNLRHAGVRRWVPWKVLTGIAAAVMLVAIGAGTFLYIRSHSPDIYATDIGERRVVALPDGSRISLDSDSEVEVHYSKATRAITLDRGRARFDVAHDVTRPFTVTAGTETVVAVGTSFNVERLDQKVIVTLIQGHVLIKEASGTTSELLSPAQPHIKRTVSLTTGEQFVAAPDTKPDVKVADLDAATGWEVGHLVFRGVPLWEAVARENRYTDHPIAVDPSAANIRISGVFNAGDIGSFVSAITGYFPVEATTDDNGRITLQRHS